MTFHAPTITAKLPAYTASEARRIEAHWLKRMPGAGKSRAQLDRINAASKPRRRRAPRPRPPTISDMRREAVLAHLRAHGPCSRSELSPIAGNMSRTGMHALLAALSDLGKVRMVGSGTQSKWVAA